MALGQIETNYSFQEDYKTEDINLKDALEKSKKYIDPELKDAKDIIEQGGDTNKIKKLNQELASMLVSKRKGEDSLELTGITSLDEDTARELAKFDGDYLVLTGLNNISNNVFDILKRSFVLSATQSIKDITSQASGKVYEYKNVTGKKLVFNVQEYAKVNEKDKDKAVINDNQYKNEMILKAVKSNYKDQTEKENSETKYMGPDDRKG